MVKESEVIAMFAMLVIFPATEHPATKVEP